MKREIVEKFEIPFVNEDGEFSFPLRAVRNVVYIFPKPIIEKTAGGIYIPASAKESFRDEYGVVMTVGPGYKRNGEFVPSAVEVGDVVLYDKNTMWKKDVEFNGKKYEVKYMDETDIKAVVKDGAQDVKSVSDVRITKNRCIIRTEKEPTRTPGGIELPANINKAKAFYTGIVEAVGDVDGINVGDRVLCVSNYCVHLQIEGMSYVIVNDQSIMAVVDKDTRLEEV